MGTFAGHAIPGSAFLVWGVWWYGHTLRHISVSEAPARPADGGPKTSSSSSDGQLPMPRDGVWKAPVYFTKLEPALKLVIRCFGLILQGMWMLQIAYLLFYLRYDTANHTNVMRAHLFFAWHWLGLAILMYLTYWMVIKRRGSRQARTRLADT